MIWNIAITSKHLHGCHWTLIQWWRLLQIWWMDGSPEFRFPTLQTQIQLLICIWSTFPFRLFLLQPMGAYCVRPAEANVESCASSILGCAPASPLSGFPPGQGDDILWGVWGRISEHFTRLGIHIHFTLIDALQCEFHTKPAGIQCLGIVLIPPLSGLVQTTFAFFFSGDQFHDYSFQLLSSFWHCYWLENIMFWQF